MAGATKGQAFDSKHSKLVSLADRIRMVCGKFIDLAKCPHAKAVAFRKARVEQSGSRSDYKKTDSCERLYVIDYIAVSRCVGSFVTMSRSVLCNHMVETFMAFY